jgi:hypothetical protein
MTAAPTKMTTMAMMLMLKTMMTAVQKNNLNLLMLLAAHA